MSLKKMFQVALFALLISTATHVTENFGGTVAKWAVNVVNPPEPIAGPIAQRVQSFIKQKAHWIETNDGNLRNGPLDMEILLLEGEDAKKHDACVIVRHLVSTQPMALTSKVDQKLILKDATALREYLREVQTRYQVQMMDEKLASMNKVQRQREVIPVDPREDNSK